VGRWLPRYALNFSRSKQKALKPRGLRAFSMADESAV